MENKEIARVLWETADLMEIADEDSFRIRSYRNGSSTVEGHPERIEDILGDPSRKVTDISGIGKGLANPTPLMQSAVLMLAHLGEHDASARLQSAIDQVYTRHECLTGDVGGNSTTDQFTDAVLRRLGAGSVNLWQVSNVAGPAVRHNSTGGPSE